MGIYAKLRSNDLAFNGIKGAKPTIVNYLENQTSDQKQIINETLYTTNGDVYNNVPSCQCGEKKGKYKIGAMCDNCHTPVTESIEEYLEHLVWIKQPEGVEKLISPHVWAMLRNKFSLGAGVKFDTIAYLTDPHYKSEAKSSKISRLKFLLEDAKLDQRGYNNFIKKFEDYMSFLFFCDVFKPRKADVDPLYHLVLKEKDTYLSEFIPIPNKSLLIIENNSYGTYIDKSLTLVIDAVRLMSGIDLDMDPPFTTKQKESRTSRALTNLSDYYIQIYKEFFSPKPGVFRKHVYGTRVDYSFRTVISSLSGPHRYDEIHIPWAVAINVLYNHIVSKLFKRGYSPIEAMSFINKYNLEYHPDMESILLELIKEAGPKGIPVLGNRNPSLGRGSIQLHHITKVKTNPQDFTTSLSLLCCVNYNAEARLSTVH